MLVILTRGCVTCGDVSENKAQTVVYSDSHDTRAVSSLSVVDSTSDLHDSIMTFFF